MDDEVIGDVVDPANIPPEPPPQEEPQEPPPEPKKEHEPPPEHPRFKEVYGRMKEFERKLNEKEELMDAILEHNKSLQESMDGLYDKVSVSEKPNMLEDPEGYERWLEAKLERKFKKEQPKQPEPKPQKGVKDDKIAEQAQIMKSMYNDFDKVVYFANEFVEKDPFLKNEILFSDNPPRALYEFGLKKREELSKKRSTSIAQASVEGGNVPPTGKEKIVLTPEQDRVRRGLGIPLDKYIAQLEHIRKTRGY